MMTLASASSNQLLASSVNVTTAEHGQNLLSFHTPASNQRERHGYHEYIQKRTYNNTGESITERNFAVLKKV